MGDLCESLDAAQNLNLETFGGQDWDLDWYLSTDMKSHALSLDKCELGSGLALEHNSL